jgi:hypothetical protein
MAKTKKGAAAADVVAPTSEPKKENKEALFFDPRTLTKEQQAAVVEEYLGIHPRFFLYKGLNIQLNHGKFRHAGFHFNGWKPASHKYSSFNPGEK